MRRLCLLGYPAMKHWWRERDSNAHCSACGFSVSFNLSLALRQTVYVENTKGASR
jgi:hypothetical protein